MKYNSLFIKEDFDEGDSFYQGEDCSNLKKYMAFEGTFEEVLQSLESQRGKFQQIMDSRQKIIWGAPRMIRGILDYKSEKVNKISFDVSKLVTLATQSALDLYSNPLSIKKSAGRIRKFISEHRSIENLLLEQIYQEQDTCTWHSSFPELSATTADCLINRFKRKDLLFILVAHGGVPAGLDVFLRYQNASDGNSLLYPVRYSTDKHKDDSPQLLGSEIKHLRRVKGNRQIIIFDEDACTGETLMGIHNLFEDVVFPREKNFVIANLVEADSDLEEINGFSWSEYQNYKEESNDW